MHNYLYKHRQWEEAARQFTNYLLLRMSAGEGPGAATQIAHAAGEVLVPYRGKQIAVADLVSQVCKYRRQNSSYEEWCWCVRERLGSIVADYPPMLSDAVVCHATLYADLDITFEQVQEALMQS